MALSVIQSEAINLADTFAFTGTVSFSGSTSGAGGYTQGTKASPTSGTTVDFTGLPSDVKVIHILFNELVTSNYGWHIVQLGDSGGFETTGYVSAVDYPGSGNNFYANSSADDNGLKIMYNAHYAFSGFATIMRMSSDQTQWVMWSRCHCANTSYSYSCYSAVEKTLSGALTQVRVTSVDSRTFSSGDINILYTT
tara:strand:+ start:140 stop:724 length:585 start_codon:yes stop_codon:yes gene_type:complete